MKPGTKLTLTTTTLAESLRGHRFVVEARDSFGPNDALERVLVEVTGSADGLGGTLEVVVVKPDA